MTNFSSTTFLFASCFFTFKAWTFSLSAAKHVHILYILYSMLRACVGQGEKDFFFSHSVRVRIGANCFSKHRWGFRQFSRFMPGLIYLNRFA